jgi:phage-related protein
MNTSTLSADAPNKAPVQHTSNRLNKDQILSQTTHRRDEATKLLASLLDAKKVSEQNLASIHQDDLLKRVTGNSSMDNAIASTRRLIDSFNRVIDDLRRNLSEDDLALT